MTSPASGIGPGSTPDISTSRPDAKLADDASASPSDDGESRSRGPRRSLVVGGLVVAAVVIGSTFLIVSSSDQPTVELPSMGAAAMEQWWSDSFQDVTALEDALDDSRDALLSVDREVMQASCTRMHDAAAVEIRTHLPAPTADLTAELEAATEDAHAAAHMCLSILVSPANNYDGEFEIASTQADRHLRTAIAIVNRTLAHSRTNAAAVG
jgi:hypothetical protein